MKELGDLESGEGQCSLLHEAADRAVCNTKLSETVLGFPMAQTHFPPEPQNKYLES